MKEFGPAFVDITWCARFRLGASSPPAGLPRPTAHAPSLRPQQERRRTVLGPDHDAGRPLSARHRARHRHAHDVRRAAAARRRARHCQGVRLPEHPRPPWRPCAGRARLDARARLVPDGRRARRPHPRPARQRLLHLGRRLPGRPPGDAGRRRGAGDALAEGEGRRRQRLHHVAGACDRTCSPRTVRAC